MESVKELLKEQEDYQGEMPAGAVAMFRGQAIYPFSYRRQTALQKIGSGIFKASSYAEHEDAEGEKTQYLKPDYPGALEDQLMVLYLCTCPDEDIILCRRNPDATARAADRWAEEIGMSFGSEIWEESTNLFVELIGGGLGESPASPTMSD
ncbi:hypothetical protein N9937_01760 [bacterium]|nr:hypothetical protein [bacterium]